MTDPSIIRTELIEENALLKKRIQKLERAESERLSMEEAYKDSEIKYRSLIEHSSDVLFCVDENGKYKFVNEVFASTFGKTPDYFLGKTFWDIYPKEHADHRQATSRKVFETGESQSVEVVVPLPDKTLYYIAKANPVRDETGKVVLNLTHAVDISERKRVEQELSILVEIGQIIGSTIDIDEVYEAFAEQVKKILPFDRIVISIICSDRNNSKNVYIAGEGILERNSTDLYPIEGSAHSEMLRTKSTVLIQTEDFSEYQDRFPRLSSTFQAGFRSIMNVPLFSKGEIIGALLLRSRKYPAYNESDKRLAERIGTQIAGAIANAQLFSDLKKTEKSLRESEENYRQLFNNSPSAIYKIDFRTGRLLKANDVICEYLGCRQEEITSISPYDFLTGESKQIFSERLAKMRLGEEVPEKPEYEVIDKNGKRRWLQLNSKKIFNAEGSVIAADVVAHDITERKIVEKEKDALAEIGWLISSTLEIDDVYERFAAVVRKLIPFDRLAVNLHSLNEENVKVAYTFGEECSGRHKGDSFPLKGSVSELLTKTRAGLLSHPDSVEEMERRFPNHVATILAGMRSLIGIPLIYRDEVIGSLHFRSKTPNAYTEQDLVLAEKIGTQIAGAIANAQLFSDLKKTEKSLRESEERYQSLFEQAGDGIFILDTRGKIISVNKASARMHGFSVEEMLCKGLDGLDVEGMSPAPERISRILRGETLSFEVEHCHKEGYIFPLSVTANLISLGSEQMIIAIHRDLTELKRAEEEKQRSLAEAERLAAEMAVIAEIGRVIGETLDIDEVYRRLAAETKRLIHFDRLAVNLHSLQDDNVTVAYVAGAQIPGRRRGDLFPMKGSTCEVLTRTRAGLLNFNDHAGGMDSHFRDHDAPVQMKMNSLLRVPLIYRDEVIGSLFFGTKTPNAYTERDLQLAEKIGAQIAGALGSAKLFSEHKQAEAERQSLQERLQRAEKMEALGQLAGGVAHDLNNVLGILSGYSELLLEEIPEGIRSRRHAEKILQSTEKGAAIIQDLLTLARRGVVVSDVINLNSIVLDFLKSPVFEKMKDFNPRVTFKTECDMNALNINGSPVHLEKTLINLVSNAAEAISGEGEVMIRTESRYLDKPVGGYDEIKDGDYAVLTVSDTGMGIPLENREKIFEPFYTKKTMGRSGTGLGLAIVWGTVKDHNGYIDVQTEIGKGTTFTLYFPVTREEMVAQQQKVPIQECMGKNESVLVVDDIAEQRDVASRLLTRLGYEVHAVSSGEEAVEYLKENKADILVLDMIMAPGIDGLETYRRILEINPRQKAILVSGFSQTERVMEAQKLGAGVYVNKPYAMEKIGVAIRGELNRKQMTA